MFTWIGCLDGASVDLTKIDAFTVGQVQKHDSNGVPLFEVADADGKAAPIMQLCVFALLGQNNFPIRIVTSMHEAQLTIQSILGNLKVQYDKERGVVQIASAEEKVALKLS